MPDRRLINRIVDAMALPSASRVDRRIPKTVLSEHGASTAAQRKLIDGTVERLDWLATLSPATVGIAAGTDEERPVPEVQLLMLAARAEPTQTLLTIIHRAIPYALILLTRLPSGGVRVSLAPLRSAERLHERMVVERLVVAPDLTAPLDAPAEAFVASLYVGGLPQADLGAVYEGLVQRVEALTAARLSGTGFRLSGDAAAAAARRDDLARHSQLETAWIAARASARKEKRLAHQVALAEQARALEKELKALASRLA
jgi:hypothetical protein